MDYPYLMNKRSCRYVPNLPEIQKQYGEQLIPITAEQAAAIDKDGKAAGAKILRDLVAADNAAALKEVEASLPPAPAPEAPAEPAEVPLKDLPLSELREMAKKDGGFPDGKDVDKARRRELLALLQP